MSLHALHLPGSGELRLPDGLVVLRAQTAAQSALVARRLAHAALPADRSAEVARLLLIEAGDAFLAASTQPAIAGAHWEELLALFREAHTASAAHRSEVSAEAPPPPADGPSLGELRAALQALNQQIRITEGEIERDMRGIRDTPGAARQVAQLGESHAEIRGQYLLLVDQRKELKSREPNFEHERRKAKAERARKAQLGAIVIVVGLLATQAPYIRPPLSYAGFAVAALGLLVVLGVGERKQHASPKEQQVRTQLERIEASLNETEIRLREAERQIRQFCAAAGCNSPGQVIDLERRFEEAGALLQRLRAERETTQAAIAAREQATLAAGLPLMPAPSRERSSADGLPGAIETANGLLERLGGVIGPLRVQRMGTEGPVLELASGQEGGLAALDPVLQTCTYCVIRAALIRHSGLSPANWSLVLDDPFRFWEDAALATGARLAHTLVANGLQVLLATCRGQIIESWRAEARTHGRLLTAIELGDPSSATAPA